MKPFNREMVDPDYYRCTPRKPDINNILKVLRREAPSRFTLFELFLSEPLEKELCEAPASPDLKKDRVSTAIEVFHKTGYDFVTWPGCDFHFPVGRVRREGTKTISLNEGFRISDRESFESYQWMEVEDSDFSVLDKFRDCMPEGMKMMLISPGGVLENTIALAGYENLCLMLADDPELVEELFNNVGKRLLEYYEKCVPHEAVGIQMANDDWGFKTQTMLSTEQMRKYVFPWHKKIVEVGHRYNKPVVLHSCGNLAPVYEDIIEDIKFDARHSFEDTIEAVELAYDQYGKRITILGGMDVDFLCRAEPEEIYRRSAAILEKTQCVGYALGSGNSIPYYMPNENYYAMIAAAHFN